MRLIDADKLFAELNHYLNRHEDTELGRVSYTIADMADMIVNAPEVDAKPVVHGRWVPITSGSFLHILLGCTAYQCSRCGSIEEENSWPYCHCGARMDEKEDENATD